MLQPHFFPSLGNPRLYWKPEIKGTLDATLQVGLSGPTEAGEEWKIKLEMQTKDTQSKSQEHSPQSQNLAFQVPPPWPSESAYLLCTYHLLGTEVREVRVLLLAEY